MFEMAAATAAYVIVTPVRDELAYIGRTVQSVARQTLAPARWVIVDDGSTDGTGALLDEYAHAFRWIEVVHRANRGHRAAGGGVMDAFHAGFSHVEREPWDFVVKLDGDLSFEPDYFERCFVRFAAEPALGIGGGTVCTLKEGRLHIDSVGDPAFHVRGATKIYRRACWQTIAPLIRAPGWDTLDEVRANLHGWRTATFPELVVVQHKPTGSADGCWANALKNGKANYHTGYHPAFMLAKCVKRLPRKPFGIESAGLLAGFVSGYLKGRPRLADDDSMRYLRRQQLRRLLLQPSIYG
jgi:poly-beta-1,6-N-acetyl-D-glucosamine synthase